MRWIYLLLAVLLFGFWYDPFLSNSENEVQVQAKVTESTRQHTIKTMSPAPNPRSASSSSTQVNLKQISKKTNPRPLNATIKSRSPDPIVANWTGSKSISLGHHKIYLKEGGWSVGIEPKLTVHTPKDYRVTQALRRTLIRSLFFLTSHRVGASLVDDEGVER